MAVIMMECLKTISQMERANFFGQMALDILDNGKQEPKKVLVSKSIKMAESLKVSGRMVNGKNGYDTFY